MKLSQAASAAPAWKNWSGWQSCQPQRRFSPQSEAQLLSFISESSGTIRTVGSGHSFSGLVPTDDNLISVHQLAGLRRHNAENLTATFGAGTRFADVGKPLQDIGQGLFNMADIDRQTIAGAISTSTHGTGRTLGSYSSYIEELKLATAKGELLTCNRTSDEQLFRAACASLGALGILTEVTLQNRPAYRLKETIYPDQTMAVLEQAEELRQKHRHFEMFPMVNADVAIVQLIDETTEPLTPLAGTDEEDDETLQMLQKYGGMFPALRRWILNTVVGGMDKAELVGESWQILANTRNMRFNEMEYQVPAEHGPDCLRDILATIRAENIDIVFPLEYRYIKADDLMLSMFAGRDACSISVHHFAEYDYRPYFALIEPIFHKYGGRPHWGKLHTLTAKQLAPLYPEWDNFLEIRERLDPDRRFINPYLQSLFGLG
ncbi:MAG: FAD-binding protein [Pseudomonadales bacterium]|nr:FAD-binding protein [Pseudomonadales bacterium]